MALSIKQFQLVEAGSTSEQLVTVSDVISDGPQTFFIRVVTGSIKFGIETVHAAANAYGPNEDLPPVACNNGQLAIKANATTDTFVLSAAPVNSVRY